MAERKAYFVVVEYLDKDYDPHKFWKTVEVDEISDEKEKEVVNNASKEARSKPDFDTINYIDIVETEIERK